MEIINDKYLITIVGGKVWTVKVFVEPNQDSIKVP